MQRRDFVKGIAGSAICWPLAVRAQEPIIGYLSTLSEAQATAQTAAFRRGLQEAGFPEVQIDFRWAEGRYEQLPAMAAELVRRPVTLILAQAPPAALSAKAATATIPIVFVVGFDPVGVGLVAGLNRPGGNATGVTLISPQLGQKRVEILHELAPKASVIGMLVNPLSPVTVPEIGSVQGAVLALGLQLTMFNASTPSEIDAAFGVITSQRPDGLIVATDPFFVNRRDQIVARTAILKIPTVYPFREYAVSGGLISYGTNLANAYRQAGIYAGRILKGDKPGDLPVLQPTVFELVINLRTARAQGIAVSAMLHARSDEVIE